MKYKDLNIQTQREFPNNARTQGFGWLVRAGYLTREGGLLSLGIQTTAHLEELSKRIDFLPSLQVPFVDNASETFFIIPTGSQEVVYCPSPSCEYIARSEVAKARKAPFSWESLLPVEKIPTPETNTIEALAKLLNIPRERTAKALMYTRIADGRFIFVVVRGDMQLSEAKLKACVGDIRLASAEEIVGAGAAGGYASPIGLKEALVVVDDLIPQSPNLVAGANESGFHLLNTNCGRDYTPDLTADLTLAREGDACFMCGNPLTLRRAEVLGSGNEFSFQQILFAIAETHHDEKGLTFPKSVAPFDVYLMHVPGKTIDAKAKAEEIYNSLQRAGISVLFDDRDERAGVKFNDADLIGCPLRVTAGEKGLKDGMVELKPRKEKDYTMAPVDELAAHVKSFLA